MDVTPLLILTVVILLAYLEYPGVVLESKSCMAPVPLMVRMVFELVVDHVTLVPSAPQLPLAAFAAIGSASMHSREIRKTQNNFFIVAHLSLFNRRSIP